MGKTKYIAFISGPSCGKTTMSALVFAELKMRNYSAELIPEYAKWLIYKQKFETLNHQYHVSIKQYKMMKMLEGQVDYVCSDSSLITGLYYNKLNPNNTSNVEKTEALILKKMEEFEHIYIYLERNPEHNFEVNGRIHDENESKKIDIDMKKMLEEYGIKYKSFLSDKKSLNDIIEYILNN